MLTMLKQMIPVWWRWLYWVNPAAWTLYGLMFSQLGDLDKPIHVPGNLDQPINVFVQDLFGFQDNDFTIIVALHFGVIVLFLSFFGFSIEKLNFQIRWLNWKRCLKQGVAHVDLFSTSIVTTANSQLRQGAQKIIFIIFSPFFFFVKFSQRIDLIKTCLTKSAFPLDVLQDDTICNMINHVYLTMAVDAKN